MTDSPFDVRVREPLDGYFAVLFLVTIPIGGRLFRWVGGCIGDYEMEGALFGYVSFYALSIGFGLGALRQSARDNRCAGKLALFVDAALLSTLELCPCVMTLFSTLAEHLRSSTAKKERFIKMSRRGSLLPFNLAALGRGNRGKSPCAAI